MAELRDDGMDDWAGEASGDCCPRRGQVPRPCTAIPSLDRLGDPGVADVDAVLLQRAVGELVTHDA